MSKTQPLNQDIRPKCSVPLNDADLSLDNSNWTKGLQAMSDWIWSANLNPSAFPNHLGRFFLQIPGVFEQQLNYSTTLIFDEPSFKNGVQVSGFINRASRELVISLIAQTRRAWYTMTHHAILGKLTSDKHGISAESFANKMYYLTDYKQYSQYYSELEIKMFDFAYSFATNPKTYTDAQFEELKNAFRAYNADNYKNTDLWLKKKEAAAWAKNEALLKNYAPGSSDYQKILDSYLSKVPATIPDDMNETKVNAQVVELAFLCLQFVALACVFTGLNIPDESFLPDVMMQLLPPDVIDKINELNEAGLDGQVTNLIPPQLGDDNKFINAQSKLFKAVLNNQVTVSVAPLKGARVPLTPYEGKDKNGEFRPAFLGLPDRDNGLSIGGIQVGVYGWSLGGHFPGSLPYCLMNHPELSRFEAPYSLPLLFNEDEWRNGVQTAGYNSRKQKELIIQKVYRLNRTRYGIEHHTMFFYNTCLDEFGVGRHPNPDFSAAQAKKARERALQVAENAVLYIHDHKNAPAGVYSPLEEEILTWVEELVKTPHRAYEKEARVREALKEANNKEIAAGTRILDTSAGIGNDAAMEILIHHQVCEMAMLTGHMDGLARALTMLKLEAEEGVQSVEGTSTDRGGIKPDLDQYGQVKFTGYFNTRPGIHFVLKNVTGLSDKVMTLNELMVCPALCEYLIAELDKKPTAKFNIDKHDEYNPEF